MNPDMDDGEVDFSVRLPGERGVHTRVALTTTQQVMASGSPILANELSRSLMNDPLFNSPCTIVQSRTTIPLSGQCDMDLKIVNGELHVNDILWNKEDVMIGTVKQIKRVESQSSSDSSAIRVHIEFHVEQLGCVLEKDQRLKIKRS